MTKQPNALQCLIDKLNKEVTILKNSISRIQEISGIGAFICINNIISKIEVFEQVIQMLDEFNFWNDADTNPPKFDENRRFPNRPTFICTVQDYEGRCYIANRYYDFEKDEWQTYGGFVRYWQEFFVPKELLK